MELEDEVIQVAQLVQSSGKTQSHTEQSASESLPKDFSTDIKQQLCLGGIAILTIAGITWLIREIRLLVQACKA